MEENLKIARTTHQVLLGLCGVYLLGLLAFESKEEAVSNITFLGFKLGNEAAFTLILGVAFLLTALRLCVYLEHIQKLPKSDDDYDLITKFPWILLFDDKHKMATILSWVETVAMLIVGYNIGHVLCQATPWIGVPYILILLVLFVCGLVEVHGITDDARRWTQE